MIIVPMIEKENKIYIRTLEYGPRSKKVQILPKGAKLPVYTTWVWVVLVVFMSISAFSFVLDFGGKVYSDLKKNLVATPVLEVFTPKENTSLSIDVPAPSEPVSNKQENINSGYYFLNNEFVEPSTSALAYFVGDLETGEIITSKGSDISLPIASITKIITALVSKDIFQDDTVISVGRSSMEAYGKKEGLRLNEKIQYSDLLPPLLIESSNDFAEVLALAHGREKYISRMRVMLSDIGMTNTRIVDPSGLSSENVSTVSDIFKLSLHVDNKYPEFWDLSLVEEYTIGDHTWKNANTLLKKSFYLGGKNGYSEKAGKVSLGVFEIDVSQNKRKIAIILLKSQDRNADIDSIIRFMENNIGFGQHAN